MNHNASAFGIGVFLLEQEPSLDNNVSEIFWADDTTAPVTTQVADCERDLIVAADVRLPRNAEYVASDNKHDIFAYAGGADRNPDHKVGNHITSAFLHELGHVAGLRHTAAEYSLMSQNTRFVHTNGSELHSYIGTDTNRGLLRLYGEGARYNDLSVSHWKFDPSGRDDEQGRHKRIEVFDVAGNVVANDWGGPDKSEDAPQFKLTRGGTYGFEFTWENNGLDQQTLNIAYVLSEDDWIDMSDRLIGTGQGVIDGLDQGTTQLQLSMPTDVELGKQYWVGAIVDPNGLLDEQDEFNATYVWVTFVE